LQNWMTQEQWHSMLVENPERLFGQCQWIMSLHFVLMYCHIILQAVYFAPCSLSNGQCRKLKNITQIFKGFFRSRSDIAPLCQDSGERGKFLSGEQSGVVRLSGQHDI
jgi:hypothetical protein